MGGASRYSGMMGVLGNNSGSKRLSESFSFEDDGGFGGVVMISFGSIVDRDDFKISRKSI